MELRPGNYCMGGMKDRSVVKWHGDLALAYQSSWFNEISIRVQWLKVNVMWRARMSRRQNVGDVACGVRWGVLCVAMARHFLLAFDRPRATHTPFLAHDILWLEDNEEVWNRQLLFIILRAREAQGFCGAGDSPPRGIVEYRVNITSSSEWIFNEVNVSLNRFDKFVIRDLRFSVRGF